MFSQTLHPGLTLGLYPEREHTRKNRLESAAFHLNGLLRRLSRHREQRAYQFCQQVNRLSDCLKKSSESAFSSRVEDLRNALVRKGINKELAVESFALVREAARRTLGQTPFDTQIMGGWVLLNGKLAEMETGEGKTLTATLPACTAALAGIPVHVVTANDYLAERDAELMHPIYDLLGLTVGIVTEKNKNSASRRNEYARDITYCTSKQLAFDYLRDRITMGHRRGRLDLQVRRLTEQSASKEQLILRGLCFGIVDEADNVLVDNADTPHILARELESNESEQKYFMALEFAGKLQQGRDYRVNRKHSDVELNEAGKMCLAGLLDSLPAPRIDQRQCTFMVKQALQALCCYRKDRDYLVCDGKVQIIDVNTGRSLPDHSWELGLHQMIEAKENCSITGARETIARISYQRLFRRYLHLSGMTGTAREVAGELWSVYGLEVVSIPTHLPLHRLSAGPDLIYPAEDPKWRTVVQQVHRLHQSGRPVLIGTASVEDSELLGQLLTQKRLSHVILNARQDKHEAEIIAGAGKPGAITVATNMAGRGTDIRLAPGVADLGGLHVIATVRNAASRIDRQLYGRCGRLGDPGSYQAILSLDDQILKKYFPRTLTGALRTIVNRWNMPILGRWAINIAQCLAERHHAKLRYQLMRFDQQLKETLAFSGPME